MGRGDVYWADLVPALGQNRRAPSGDSSVVRRLQPDFQLEVHHRVPVSTWAAQTRRALTVVGIPTSIVGLAKTSMDLCHQATTVDRAQLTRRIGAQPPDLMEDVGNALKAALDLDCARVGTSRRHMSSRMQQASVAHPIMHWRSASTRARSTLLFGRDLQRPLSFQ
jgi:mRNA-degrading endonuclease toxin of MazEF toxin-antitoxin module